MSFKSDLARIRGSQSGGLVLIIGIALAVVLIILAFISWYWAVIVSLVYAIIGGLAFLGISVWNMVKGGR